MKHLRRADVIKTVSIALLTETRLHVRLHRTTLLIIFLKRNTFKLFIPYITAPVCTVSSHAYVTGGRSLLHKAYVNEIFL